MTVKFENLDRNEDVVTSWKEDVVTAFSVLEHLSGPRLRWEPLCSSSADTERDIPRQAAPPVKYDCLVSTSDNLKFNFSINSKLFSAGRERESVNIISLLLAAWRYVHSCCSGLFHCVPCVACPIQSRHDTPAVAAVFSSTPRLGSMFK